MAPAVRLSVCLQVEFGQTDVYEIWYWQILRQLFDTFQIWLSSDNYEGILHEDLYVFLPIEVTWRGMLRPETRDNWYDVHIFPTLLVFILKS
jgi:hypothetical protein